MTIRDYFERTVSDFPDAVFQRFHDGVRWTSRTYAESRLRVLRAVSVVGALVPKKAGPSRVAIMLENCPDWQLLYVAITGIGLTVVPIDPKLRAAEVSHILRDSESVCVFAGEKQRAVIERATSGFEVVPQAVYDLETRLAALSPSDLDQARRRWGETRPREETLASLIYTSGTTGRPKGAMLTHGCFAANVEQTLKRVPFRRTDNFLNVLPLFHAFSFTGNFLLPLCVGASTSFMRSLRTIAEDMQELHPSILLAVPLLAEKLYRRIESNLNKSLVATGLMRFNLSRKFIARKILERFGGKMRLIGIGGAPTAHDTLRGFQKLGLDVLEGYGITECAPGVAYPALDSYKIGTVGPVLAGMEYKLANPDETGAGELCVKGPNVMKGYWKNPEQTAAAFDGQGFYKTGDIVRIDESGNVSICGRTKALIVNREGKNIYPEEIEQALEHAPLIKDVIVLGYRVGTETGEHVGAILVPDEDAIASHLKGRILTRDEMAKFIRDYALGVCRASVADYKIPRKFEIRFEPLERTSSMKVRRVVYAKTLDEA
ncbi:MAG: AMP-dependent synthetase/ligase [Kiritimatiellia bacterium]